MTTHNTEGTWGHSAPIGGKEYVIFSVDRATDTDLVEITARRHAVMAFMGYAGISFKAVWGCYKGAQELSYIVEAFDFNACHASDLLAEQESFLELGICDARDRRPAGLKFTNGDYVALGLFQQVTEDVAKAQDGYTFDPTTGHYFACLPDKPFLSDRQKLDAIIAAYDQNGLGLSVGKAIEAAR